MEEEILDVIEIKDRYASWLRKYQEKQRQLVKELLAAEEKRIAENPDWLKQPTPFVEDDEVKELEISP